MLVMIEDDNGEQMNEKHVNERWYSNLVYAQHFYADTHRKYFRKCADYAISKGLALFVTESAGVSAVCNKPVNDREWQLWIDWMKQNQISWKESDMQALGIKTRTYLRNEKITNVH